MPVIEPEVKEVSEKKEAPEKTEKKKPAGKPAASSSPGGEKKSPKSASDKTKKAKKGKEAEPETRPIKYSTVAVTKLFGESGRLTAAIAREILGWSQAIGEGDFGSDFLLKDRNEVKTRCRYNSSNRPFKQRAAEQWMYEILQGNWRFNGETFVVGQTGTVLDGQHRLIGLILAAQEWEKSRDVWVNWTEEPSIEALIVYGVPEDRHTINTLGTGVPRSLADAIYSCGLFEGLDGARAADRSKLKDLCKLTDYAVRLLWERTWAGVDAWAPRRTHAESLDFLDRHPRVLTAVKHIYEENGDGKISQLLPAGYAAGMLYLMGTSATEREKDDGSGYSQVDPCGEEQLDFSRWSAAEDFWVELAARKRTFQNLMEALGDVATRAEGGAHRDEDLALIVKAWNRYAAGKSVNAESLQLTYERDGDGVQRLVECPTCGGIDLGKPEPDR